MADVSTCTEGWMKRTLRGNISLLLGEKGGEPLRPSPFERAVLHALSSKGVDGSYSLVVVPINYHPATGELQLNNGNAMPAPFAQTKFSVSVQNRVPTIKQSGLPPGEHLAGSVIEQTIRLYNLNARAIPYH